MYLIDLSQRFVAASGATRAAIDTGVPGYLPAWQIDLDQQYFRYMAAMRQRGEEQLISSTNEVINGQLEAQAVQPSRSTQELFDLQRRTRAAVTRRP